jgi:hypothetical protein
MDANKLIERMEQGERLTADELAYVLYYTDKQLYACEKAQDGASYQEWLEVWWKAKELEITPVGTVA